MTSGTAASPSEAPSRCRFEGALTSSFRVHLHGAASLELRLEEVAVFDRRPGWESFSLLFTGPDPPAFSEGTFAVEHAELGSFLLYLVAIQTIEGGQYYEAVFNRHDT